MRYMDQCPYCWDSASLRVLEQSYRDTIREGMQRPVAEWVNHCLPRVDPEQQGASSADSD